MNPETMMEGKVVLVCEDCGKKSDKKTRIELVDDNWNWQEFEIEDVGIERVALCQDCFSSEKLVEAVLEYREERGLISEDDEIELVDNSQKSLDRFETATGDPLE